MKNRNGVVKKILVAEDDPSTRMLIKKSVEMLKHIVIQSSNGEVAFSILKDNPDIDLLITDMEMPVMGGRDLIDGLRSNKQLRDIPVIIVSGIIKASQVKDILKFGAARFMAKPINSTHLKDYIDQLLSN